MLKGILRAAKGLENPFFACYDYEEKKDLRRIMKKIWMIPLLLLAAAGMAGSVFGTVSEKPEFQTEKTPGEETAQPAEEQIAATQTEEAMQNDAEIYLAGGCFWGTEYYFQHISGVISVESGYANGRTANPTYEEVCSGSGHAETVKVIYDPQQVSLRFLLQMYFRAIDPISVNQQGNDRGEQYRTGIYYTRDADKPIIAAVIADEQKNYSAPIAVEVKPLENYYPAEDYHQDYLTKNPNGYCHIPKSLITEAAQTTPEADEVYEKLDTDALKMILSDEEFDVTQNAATERPFLNRYVDTFEPGIYVDVTTGQPLFVSTDKFESGCGWPAFSKPIDQNLIQENTDTSYGMMRSEVRSKLGGAHLGHVFTDGPKESGGLRYCINSAALRFIPKEKMVSEGYGKYLDLLDQGSTAEPTAAADSK